MPFIWRGDMTKKSLAIITGASRGIGRALALALADEVCAASSDHEHHQNIHMVLIARSAEALQETANMIESDKEGSGGAVITTSCHALDLSDIENLPLKFQEVIESLSSDATQYDKCLLINNAGSVGPLGRCESVSSSSMKELSTAINLNITSSIWLSSQFTKIFANKECHTEVRIVNISSICAIEPFPTMSIYCAGKSARDMYHSVLAKENNSAADEKDSNGGKEKFKVLNYAPG